MSQKPRKPREKRENPIPLKERQWLSPQDAADYGSMGLSTVYLYMKHGYIRYTKRGRSTRINRVDDLDPFLASDRPVIQQPKKPKRPDDSAQPAA